MNSGVIFLDEDILLGDLTSPRPIRRGARRESHRLCRRARHRLPSHNGNYEHGFIALVNHELQRIKLSLWSSALMQLVYGHSMDVGFDNGQRCG